MPYGWGYLVAILVVLAAVTFVVVVFGLIALSIARSVCSSRLQRSRES